MDIIFVFTTFFLFILGILLLASRLQYKKGQRLCQAFSNGDLKTMEVRFSETSYSGLSQYGGTGTKAKLHHAKSVLLITATDKWFNRLYNHLPMVLTSLERKELPICLKNKEIADFHIDKYLQYTIGKGTLITRKVQISLSSEKDSDRLRQILTNFKEEARQQVMLLQ